MATSNRERVGAALDVLRDGLQPFVQREMQAEYKRGWLSEAQKALSQGGAANFDANQGSMDTQAALRLIQGRWNEVFGRKLSQTDRAMVNELIQTRNKWAHQEAFTADDLYSALDSIERLLGSVGASEQRAEMEREKHEVLRLRFEEQTKRETKRVAATPVAGQPVAGLRPWRDVVTPHPDVASGRYQQAEFAADLGQVQRGTAEAEYGDPVEFFRRTYLTDGLKDLIALAVGRLSGTGGEPDLELQTNFGGGKTHAMLALYHLCTGKAPPSALSGIEELLAERGLSAPPTANTAVLVGTALSPAEPRRKPDGTIVNTLWGELAWQIGGSDGYELVQEADRAGVSPGSDALRDLFDMFEPCVVLIDEWVAYVRLLYGIEGLPGGNFENNLTFAQSLTEAARQSKRALVVATIPSSDIETGGEAGRAALARIQNTFQRIGTAWRPASSEEGFEIVRRRLFQPLVAADYPARDAVLKAFADEYRGSPSDFPSNTREADYEHRLQAAYPIHPELFDTLYGEWSTLDRFQRTRGVLRLMAGVIHTLWERGDTGLLITPGRVPMDEPSVLTELTRYLDQPWVPVIERDVDGPSCLPLAIDRENAGTLGRYSAARKVARTIFLGSAPTLPTGHSGIDDRRIRLGCAEPGEQLATYGDALRRLADDATHLYVDNGRYWYSTQPSVNRMAQDRAVRVPLDDVHEEIKRRLREVATRRDQRGDFARVHAVPGSSGDVPDEPEARLVILGPEWPHSPRSTDSEALHQVAAILDQRAGGPRNYKNALVFLAPDRARLNDLEQAVRQFLAWKSIDEEREILNLDAHQTNQARTKRKDTEDAVVRRIPEAYSLLLYPAQEPQKSVEWEERRLQGDGGLADRASRRLRTDEALLIQWAPTLLRLQLDRIPLWRGDHVPVKQLWEDFAKYPYLPRLRDAEVLLVAIREGINGLFPNEETFAYAEGFDDVRGRYRGLRAQGGGSVMMEGGTLVVKPDAARRQLDADTSSAKPTTPYTGGDNRGGTLADGPATDSNAPSADDPVTPQAPKLRRYHAAKEADPVRLERDASDIAKEILQHLNAIPGATVTISIEISAELPEGASDTLVRTLSENARVLKFTTSGFEAE